MFHCAIISSCYIQLLQQTLAAANLTFDTVAKQLAIDKSIDDINVIEFIRVMEHCAIELSDESLHLCNKKLLPGTNDFVLKSLHHCQTIEQLLQEIARAYNFIHGGAYNYCEVSNSQLRYIVDDSTFEYASTADTLLSHCMLDSMLVLIHGITSYLTSDDTKLNLLQVNTKSNNESLLNSIMTNVPVKFEEKHYSLIYTIDKHSNLLNQDKLKHLNLTLIYSYLSKMLNQQQAIDNHASILDQVRNELHAGTLCQEKMADKLNISTATLRRRLAEYQISFRELKNNELNKQAKARLMQGSSLYDISDALQFSDERSFIRAFKSWNGITPMQFINQQNSENLNTFK
ncbi:helix-turn-helix domain-containing protein [Thalassotalea sp. G2M2-11]|uniref:helix-turn-helix domain-containing protein n=1 Tax=Thalassotalea sp. G2M2-11 TaxID=2787627 RepID=UPI0019D22F46|nr:helix-turn-helix domain-containing protein [Thalassotalea sp. G2M2-11]